jgi:hypothetical protein
MKWIFLVIIMLCLACNDKNVNLITKKESTKRIFAIDMDNGDTIYLREVIVDYASVFFVCTKEGKLFTGTSVKTGKSQNSAIIPE